MNYNIIGIAIGLTFLTCFILLGRYYNKLSWSKVKLHAVQYNYSCLGTYELLIRQPEAIISTPRRWDVKLLFGINRALIYTNEQSLIFFPWSEGLIVNNYFHPFKITLSEEPSIENDIFNNWAFESTNFKKEETDLHVEFIAKARLSTAVKIRCIKK